MIGDCCIGLKWKKFSMMYEWLEIDRMNWFFVLTRNEALYHLLISHGSYTLHHIILCCMRWMLGLPPQQSDFREGLRYTWSTANIHHITEKYRVQSSTEHVFYWLLKSVWYRLTRLPLENSGNGKVLYDRSSGGQLLSAKLIEIWEDFWKFCFDITIFRHE